uniref:Uncharacterized protein n=1 Tax=Pristionchus pacificus TaxID=54126 RepID=A0A2A6D0T9_PRIPA
SSPFRSLPFTLRKEGVNINPRESPKTNRQLEKKRLNRRGITQANSRQGSERRHYNEYSRQVTNCVVMT